MMPSIGPRKNSIENFSLFMTTNLIYTQVLNLSECQILRKISHVKESSSKPVSRSLVNKYTTGTMKRKEQTHLPDNAIDGYVECAEAFYPNIKVSLKIFATVPVTTATTERTFSVLKLLKTYLRSTLSEARLIKAVGSIFIV
jgi:hypothetical protein